MTLHSVGTTKSCTENRPCGHTIYLRLQLVRVHVRSRYAAQDGVHDFLLLHTCKHGRAFSPGWLVEAASSPS